MTLFSSLLKPFLPLASGLMIGATALLAPAQAALSLETISPSAQEAMPPLPDATGRAGMAAAAVPAADASSSQGDASVILAAGGANFPDAAPWEGGKKVFHADIFQFANGQWSVIGTLPKPLAYAAFAGTPQGLVIAGGANADGHLAEVYLVGQDGKTAILPSLPKPIAYPAFSYRNGRLYVFGGQEQENSTTALKDAYMLDLSNLSPENRANLAWKALPPLPGKGRILATAGATGSRIYLFGGASLAPDADNKAARTYLNEAIAFEATKNEWVTEPVAPLPETLAASASPAPAREGKIILIGGDNGSHYGKSPQTHPGQSSDILLYDTLTNTWEKGGNWSLGLATAPTVVLDGHLYTISGETKPGIRTPENGAANMAYSLDLHLVDYAVFVLIAVVLLILILQIMKHGVKNVAIIASADSKPGSYAWVVVGLLWTVAMLNYFDRQLLTTIREPVIRDIPQTEMQFGLLTGIFLLIYSVLSPVGGFMADRFSRRIVIMVSLVVWSCVTWLTGHVHDYTTLFIARACMGISEACYIPAALALITDYHRGRTRSLATGIHMSGVYAGMALAGMGGTIAEMTGWRLTFGLFGLIGVAYALVLVLFLRDPNKKDAADSHAAGLEVENPTEESISLPLVFSNILKSRAMWILMGVVACAGAANWFLLAWFPTLLQEKFNLSLGEAGTNATLWSTMAKYIAVIVGAIIADQWSLKNPRSRSLLPGIIFCAAGPLIALSPFIPGDMTGALALLLIFVATQGLAQGTMDATLMPVMRSHIDGRFAATGYGFLNLVSAGFGAITVIYSGKLKDLGISLSTTLAYTGGLLLIGGILFLLVPKPEPKEAGRD